MNLCSRHLPHIILTNPRTSRTVISSCKRCLAMREGIQSHIKSDSKVTIAFSPPCCFTPRTKTTNVSMRFTVAAVVSVLLSYTANQVLAEPLPLIIPISGGCPNCIPTHLEMTYPANAMPNANKLCTTEFHKFAHRPKGCKPFKAYDRESFVFHRLVMTDPLSVMGRWVKSWNIRD